MINLTTYTGILAKFEKLESENKTLKEEVNVLKKDNGDMKTKYNTIFFKSDALNQYGRKENFRIHKYPEPRNTDDDNSETAVFAVAKKLGIAISKEDIQRCHRVGKPRRSGPRSIIVKLKYWSKRMEFIKSKSKLYDAKWNIKDNDAESSVDQDTTLTNDDGDAEKKQW